MLYSPIPIQDWETLVTRPTAGIIIAKVLIRILMLAPVIAVCVLPLIFLTNEMLGSAVGFLILTIILPVIICCLYVCTLYDKMVDTVQELFDLNY